MVESATAKLRAIIVDDEVHGRQALRKALSDYAYFEIIAECENGLQAVKAVNELKPDLLFLDIQMPKLDGFDVLELLGDETPYVVFVTAHDEYALRAFDTNAVDYLLKPLDPERIKKTVAKITERMNSNQLPAFANLLEDREQEHGTMQRILVREKSDVHVIAADAILYIEAADDYVAIHTEAATHIKLDRLNSLEAKLDRNQFCRIHRSVLLNINYLARIESESKDSKLAILRNDKQLPISRSGYASLRKFL